LRGILLSVVKEYKKRGFEMRRCEKCGQVISLTFEDIVLKIQEELKQASLKNNNYCSDCYTELSGKGKEV
jgi:uncharacterized protein with PIN domain